MLSDFKIIRHDFDTCDGITVIPIADVHLGAAQCMEKEFKELLKYVEETPDVYLTLGGDLINNGLRGSVGNPFDEIYRPSEQKRMMTDLLYPVKDRILCGVGGNHEARSTKDSDTDITLDIFSKLDIERLYRPNVAFCHISFGRYSADHKKKVNYILAVAHGCGGGALTGASVNRNERFAYLLDGVDVLLTGHTHKPVVTSPMRLRVDMKNGLVRQESFKVVTSSSWLSYGGYALNKMLSPASQSEQKLYLNGKEKETSILIK